MDQLTAAIEDVDDIGIEILQRLEDMGGTADSSELREDMDGVAPDIFNYRRRKYLVPYGLVETEQPPGKGDGRMPAKILTLTDLGREFLDEVDETASSSIEGRIEQLEARINTLEQENQQLQERNRELQSALEQSGAGEIADELRGIQDSINSLQDRVQKIETQPVIADSDTTAIINAALVAGNTSRDFLREEFGEEAVLETQEDLVEEFENKDKLLGK